MQIKQRMAVLLLTALSASAFAQAPQEKPPRAPEARPQPAPIETREQYLQHAAQRFEVLDTNKDGQLTLEERQARREFRVMLRDKSEPGNPPRPPHDGPPHDGPAHDGPPPAPVKR